MQIRSVMVSYFLLLKSGKYWMNDISGKIEAVFLKLGTTNVHQKRNKMTPLVLSQTIWRHHWSNLHYKKTSISLKRKKIFQKEKRDSSVLWKAFQVSTNYFSLHRHFNVKFKCTTVKKLICHWKWHENVETCFVNWNLPFLCWEFSILRGTVNYVVQRGCILCRTKCF